MRKIASFTVVPKLSPKLEPLRKLAFNYCWCWDPEAIDLFFRVDRELWIQCNQNPVKMLGLVSQDRLEALEQDDGFMAHLERVYERAQHYLTHNDWRERHPDAPENFNIAYFSFEYGIHESLTIYSGGLGVLSGDHMKSSSDLGLPMVGVGFLYREGYFTQYLNADGWQQERYPQNDFYNLAVTRVQDADGKDMVVSVNYPGRVVKARVWRIDVGRVPLYMMDTDFAENDPDDREITARLYGGDLDMRIRQEIMLGMGGVQMLHQMGIRPSIYHMNEGHSAFMTLERIRTLVQEESLDIKTAIETVKAASVFTTHTPVPAGNDMFSPEMLDYYFKEYAQEISMPMTQLLGLGRQDPNDSKEPFCMTVLALRLSSRANGVSALHGATAREMWQRTWLNVPEVEVPITSITNGIHTRFWVSRDMASLYDRYIGPDWVQRPHVPEVWDAIEDVPDAELWRTHERRRERMVNFVRRRLENKLRARTAPQAEIEMAHEVLDPETLTIGFARRFATYKRGYLFMMNPERLVRLLTNPERPVQLVVAGKAHPADNQGKELIRRIIHTTRHYNLRHHIVFVEDYDINVARYMVQGVDCWLNTPRRPMEASGTSGMKVSPNGGLNISIPDGWWVEAQQHGVNGWSIGGGETYTNSEEQDIIESEMLYEMLEEEIVPMFYDRGRDGLPRRWIQCMKQAIRTIAPVFNTHRMVQEYVDRFYLPNTVRRNALRADERAGARKLGQWKSKVGAAWSRVRVEKVESGPRDGLPYGAELEVSAVVFLDGIAPEDVTVEVYYGDVGSFDRIVNGREVQMAMAKELDNHLYQFKGAIPCDKTGQRGFTVRVIPHHPDLAVKHETGLITWA